MQNEPAAKKNLMTPEEVAKYLGIHEMTFYRWCKAKTIPAFKIGGRWRVDKEHLDAYLTSREVTRGA